MLDLVLGEGGVAEDQAGGAGAAGMVEAGEPVEADAGGGGGADEGGLVGLWGELDQGVEAGGGARTSRVGVWWWRAVMRASRRRR